MTFSMLIGLALSLSAAHADVDTRDVFTVKNMEYVGASPHFAYTGQTPDGKLCQLDFVLYSQPNFGNTRVRFQTWTRDVRMSVDGKTVASEPANIVNLLNSSWLTNQFTIDGGVWKITLSHLPFEAMYAKIQTKNLSQSCLNLAQQGVTDQRTIHATIGKIDCDHEVVRPARLEHAHMCAVIFDGRIAFIDKGEIPAPIPNRSVLTINSHDEITRWRSQ